MSEGKLQFRVGLFVIVSAIVAMGIVLRFGEMRSLWEKRYTIAVNFDEAPGVQAKIPVRKSGVRIGNVREVLFNDKSGGVTVLIDVLERYSLRADTRAQLSLSLLGDASIELTPGRSKELLKPGAIIKGEAATDPLKMVARLETSLVETLESFQDTSKEWQKVAGNVNGMLDSQQGKLTTIVEEAATALSQFSQTMQVVNTIFSNPQNQKNIQETLAALPNMARETQQTIRAVRVAVEKADQNLTNLAEATAPLADHSSGIVTKLERSVNNLDVLLAELTIFARHLSAENGSLKMLATNPDLYLNLNRSASSLDILLTKLQPIFDDVRTLSDKLARHPELLGVGGAIRGSNGLKEANYEEPAPKQQPATRTTNQPLKRPLR